ncbi:uncharacterized protein C8A04DRAFT_35263 [Dichotomopilus funicola]|uniref:Uncharacterized protein n=1 Tax=Dichotomopilus funicola TaxID=1934379 RepID=A0AAN6V6V3_9PEZI|nr:hypothetical protein C8A04DRAFT_35263 [Dichotomopilus funicola]
MASRDSPPAPALPEPVTLPNDEHRIEPLVENFSTVKEIIEYIVKTRQDLWAAGHFNHGGELLVRFHWQASKAGEVDKFFNSLNAALLDRDHPKISRFEYDYESETVYLDIMPESRLHSGIQYRLNCHIWDQIRNQIATERNISIRHFLKSIRGFGTATISDEEKIYSEPDFSFGQAKSLLPSLIAALMIDIEYPDEKKAWVNLLVTGNLTGSWALFHDDDVDQQPAGQVALYLSDFVGLVPDLPVGFCRPSATEVAAGITRTPLFVLTFERLRFIFRDARSMHRPDVFTMEDGDMDENPYEELKVRHREGLKEGFKMGHEKGREEGREEERVKNQRRFAEMERYIAQLERERHVPRA